MTVMFERGRHAGAKAWHVGVVGLRRNQTLIGALGLAGLVVVCGAWLFHEGRNLTFYLDEWYFPLYRLNPFTADSLLAPHNGHIAVVPALIYEGLLRAFGMTQYTPFRSLVLVMHLGIGVLVYLFARKRIGPIAALAPTAVILLLGKGAEDFLFAFQINFLGSVLTGLACLLLIDHRSLLARLAIVALLTLSVGFSEVGLAFLLAVAVALAVERRWRDGWMVAIPGVLYVLWYLRYGRGQSDLTFTNFIHAPQWMAEDMAGSAGAAVGLSQDWGRILLLLLAYFVVRSVVRGGGSGTIWSLLAGAGLFWLLLGLTRSAGGSPYTSRFLYIGALFIILIGVELAGEHIRFGSVGLAVLGLATVAIVASNLVDFYSLRDFFDSQAAYTRTDLGALEIARTHVQPTYVFSDPSHGLPNVLASAYFSAVARYGSSAYTPAEIATAPLALRVAADQVLERLEPIVVSPVESVASACRPAAADRSVESDIGAGGVIVAPTSQPVRVSARRFAGSGSISIGRLNPGRRYRITAQRDESTTPWKLLTTSASTYSLCTASK